MWVPALFLNYSLAGTQAQLETAKAVEAEAEKCCATAQEACETMVRVTVRSAPNEKHIKMASVVSVMVTIDSAQ